MISQFLLWLCAWCQLLDGIIGVITLGSVRTSAHLWMAKKYSKYQWGNKKWKRKYPENSPVATGGSGGGGLDENAVSGVPSNRILEQNKELRAYPWTEGMYKQ